VTAEKDRRILLASRPRGEPTPDNFKRVETAVPEAGPGHILAKRLTLWWLTSPTPAPVVESFALTRCVRNDLPLSIPDANGVAVTPVIAGFHRSNSVGLAYTRKRVGASEPTRVKD
jgi:hypothetical protein